MNKKKELNNYFWAGISQKVEKTGTDKNQTDF